MLLVQRRRAPVARLAMLVATVLLAAQGMASAQMAATRIGPFAVDVRGSMPRFGPTEEQAAAIGYAKTDLPTRGWGLDVGAHWYPVTWHRVTLGLGGNAMLSSGHSTPEDAKGEPTGREADTRFRTVASQVSLNFGNGEGWSYLSGGIGYSTFVVSNENYPEPASLARRRTINYGGGARWSVRRHVSFSLDLRFYRIAAQTATGTLPAEPGTARMVLGAGLSFR